MCKCCLTCLETCYWNLIEEKFCFDENIALYQEPAKKSNNNDKNHLFDNIAFFDSVSVIAGRAIVTIDPLPDKRQKNQSSLAATAAIVDQPKKLKRLQKKSKDLETHYLKESALKDHGISEKIILENDEIDGKINLLEEDVVDTERQFIEQNDIQEKLLRRKHLQYQLKKPSTTTTTTTTPRNKFPIKKSVSFHNIPEKTYLDNPLNFDKCNVADVKTNEFVTSPTTSKIASVSSVQSEEYDDEIIFRKKTLRERRMSKSLSLKIELPELPIIRQNSMPKFYLDTPDESQIKESTLIKKSASVLKSPLTTLTDFTFDLHSIVQLQKEQQQQQQQHNSSTSSSSTNSSTAILKSVTGGSGTLRSTPPVPIHRESSRLNIIKEKMKLKKSKSTVNAASLPYTSNYI